MRKPLAALFLAGLSQVAFAAPLPLEIGKEYYIALTSVTPPLELLRPGTPVKIVRTFDYPWVEVEYRWTPDVSIQDGKQVAPQTKVLRRYLNLDHVASIRPNDGKPVEREEPAAGGDGGKGE